MANKMRGEIAAHLNDQKYTLCLTLGALAELESGFQEKDINALIARFATGRFSSRDLVRIIGAGLRGGGTKLSDEEVADMQTEGGAAGMAKIAIELLTMTFGKENVNGDEPDAATHSHEIASDQPSIKSQATGTLHKRP